MGDSVDAMVGRRLRRRRRLMGKTQAQLAAACGVTFQQIQKYECAYCRLSVGMLWKLACALEVDIGYFFAGLPLDLDVDRGAPGAAAPHAAEASPEGRPRADAA